MLFFVQPLSENSVINCRALWPLHSYRFLINILSSLMNGIKVAAFAWYSVKIRVIFGVRFERRKAHKSKPTVKLKHGNSIVEYFEYLCQISSNRILSFTVSKLVHFWDKVLSLLLLRSVLSLPSRLCPLLIFFPPFLPRTPLPHSYIQLGGIISAVSSLVLAKAILMYLKLMKSYPWTLVQYVLFPNNVRERYSNGKNAITFSRISHMHFRTASVWIFVHFLVRYLNSS